eukprot:GHRQ01020242.1.p2 GENE.GHRQ01020242.1~~GHRQ01020242.1.p2  ORF type:complete len:115 (+),score=30.84 GHRQ01020242.1:677-1021(+)
MWALWCCLVRCVCVVLQLQTPALSIPSSQRQPDVLNISKHAACHVSLLLQLQAHRAELYSSLSKGFRDFLGHGQEGRLARLMAADITPGFAAVSQQVRGGAPADRESMFCCMCL